MPANDNLSDRKDYLIAEALIFTIEAFRRLPIEHRPDNNIVEMEQLLTGMSNRGTREVYISLARRRLELLLSHKG
jgi:hypothetical protein